MNATPPIASTSAPSRPATVRPRRVIDAPTRVFHWLFALCFLGAYLTADGERWRLLHVTLGYTLAGLFAFRVAWGLAGPRHARLALLLRKLSGGPAWLKSAARGGSLAAINWRQGQNLLMALAVAALLALVVPVTLSGYATYNDWGGEWLEDLHEAAGETFLWVVLAHLSLIAGLSVLRRKNQALPMLTGHVEGSGPDLVRNNHSAMAIVVLLAVLAFWSWEWQQSPNGLVPLQNGGAMTLQSDHDDD
ncbi:cytochrome b/b6 domain-containing protein [Ramlibacter sp. H39-3-26]|uniref:cytochrome b/b6 domain-containing protein n=1 Tax=Curvibacter soli TaxID=3031331 RepID=UPI0023DA1E6B|nr:cytochrome b/b6 domain-containing protein [Ramlibacter sp. H39-3-26]MDF1486450.1 cytochrome b/b6 domain-containing protein [Ramlibacter sp. H39-3-26]